LKQHHQVTRLGHVDGFRGDIATASLKQYGRFHAVIPCRRFRGDIATASLKQAADFSHVGIPAGFRGDIATVSLKREEFLHARLGARASPWRYHGLVEANTINPSW
jgi:hypothetical protein